MYRKPRIALVLCLLLCLTSVAAAKPLAPAESWVPEDAIAVVQISEPGAILDLALHPKLVETVTSSPAYRQAATQPGFRQFMNVLEFLENRLDTDWQAGLRKLTGGGITLAVGPDESALLIVDCEDAEMLKELHDIVLFFARGEAEKQGDPDRIASAEYRGVTGWTFAENESHAIVDSRLLISNKPEVLKAAIDRRDDPSLASIAGLDSYQAAKQALHPDAAATVFVRFDILKQLPKIAAGLKQETNPLVSLLFAPVTQTLLNSTWLGLGLQSDGNTLKWQAVTDAETPGAPDPAAFATPAKPGDGAMPNLSVPRRIAALSFYRDLHGFYAAKDELFPERTSGLIFFENMMGIFFTGRDLTEEVLAETAPDVRFVVAEQAYDPAVGKPAVQFPAFAAVFRMRNPEKFGPIVEEAWQKAVGLINFTRGQQALPGLIIDRPTAGDVKYTVAYFSASDEEDSSALDVRFNFRPAVAMPGEYLILSSTSALADDLIGALESETSKPQGSTHSLVELDGIQLRSILDANRENLIRQNMVADGNTREEAETQIGLILTILQQLAGMKLDIGAQDGVSYAELAIELNLPE